MNFRVSNWKVGYVYGNVVDDAMRIICRGVEECEICLIVQAPEMYRIFKEFCDSMEKGETHEVRSKRAYAKMKAILDKIDKMEEQK